MLALPGAHGTCQVQPPAAGLGPCASRLCLPIASDVVAADCIIKMHFWFLSDGTTNPCCCGELLYACVGV